MTSFFITFSVESVEKDMVFGTSPFGCNLGYDNAIDIILNNTDEIARTIDRASEIQSIDRSNSMLTTSRLSSITSLNRRAEWPLRS